MDFASDSSSSPVQTCRVCLGLVQISMADEGRTVFCPHCGESFVVSSAQASTENVDSGEGDGGQSSNDSNEAEKLSVLRIANLSRARRAASRTTSYYIAAAGGCVIGIAEVVYGVMVNNHFRMSVWWWLLCLVLIGLFLAGAWYFLRAAAAFGKQVSRRPPEEPLMPPDFSTLSDGSQQVKNLERMRLKGEE